MARPRLPRPPSTPTATLTGAWLLACLRGGPAQARAARAAIRLALARAEGNQAQAARALAIGRNTLWRILADDPSIGAGIEYTGPGGGRLAPVE